MGVNIQSNLHLPAAQVCCLYNWNWNEEEDDRAAALPEIGNRITFVPTLIQVLDQFTCKRSEERSLQPFTSSLVSHGDSGSGININLTYGWVNSIYYNSLIELSRLGIHPATTTNDGMPCNPKRVLELMRYASSWLLGNRNESHWELMGRE